MPQFRFEQPVEARIKQDKFQRFAGALARMGMKQKFRATGVSDDGTKVFVDPTSLSVPIDAHSASVNARLVEFDPNTLAVLHSRKIPFDA